MNKIYNDDCFNVFDKIENKKVDLVLVDLPYGQTACDWDVCIDLKAMWDNLKRLCKDNCMYVFFTTTKFGNQLINSNPKWFRYDLVWEKHIAVGYLNANRQPLRAHEMIYIFSSMGTDDLELTRNLEMREYAKKVLKFIGKKYSEIQKELGHMKACHFLSCATSTQFSLPTEKTYNELIERYKIDMMEGFIKYEDFKYESLKHTYNPQKIPGKPYKATDVKKKKSNVYGKEYIHTRENKGDRHPKSIIKFHQSDDKLHPTQKPVDQCEWLIKTYSNEGDLVLDFCMGSGSTIVACMNTNRNYIGIEKDKDIFKVAKNRIDTI